MPHAKMNISVRYCASKVRASWIGKSAFSACSVAVVLCSLSLRQNKDIPQIRGNQQVKENQHKGYSKALADAFTDNIQLTV